MKRIAVISWIALLCSCQIGALNEDVNNLKTPTKITNIKPVGTFLTAPQEKVFVIAGQSNCGIYTTAQLGGVYTHPRIKVWNYFLSKFENKVDPTNQFYGNKGGVVMPFVKKMVVKYPNDTLVFIQYHKGGTNLSYHWNVSSDSLFKNLNHIMDSALVKAGYVDEINFIWIQGEADTHTSNYANTYLTNEVSLFDSLYSRHTINKFAIYQLPSNLGAPSVPPYLSIVRSAKVAHTASNIHLIWPKGMNYNIDNIHLSLTGITQLADSLKNNL